jgi:hypothetical protein
MNMRKRQIPQSVVAIEPGRGGTPDDVVPSFTCHCRYDRQLAALKEAGIAARKPARYEDAERLFLLAGREAEGFDQDDPRVAATLSLAKMR